MKIKKVIGFILKLPLILMVLASFGASIYAAYYKIQGITWASPIILGALICLYLIGIFLCRTKKSETKTEINDKEKIKK